MPGVLLTTNQTLIQRMLDPGIFLFGVLLILFGMVLPLVLMMRREPFISRPLAGLLCIIECVLLGILALEFAGVQSGTYALQETAWLTEMLHTHRWLLFQIPVFLNGTAAILLFLYREEIATDHARDYRLAVIVSVFVSFASILIIAFESMI